MIESGFNILDWASGGDCEEHRGRGQVLVKDYAYIYPNGQVLKMSIGWVCEGCISRGYTILESKIVKIVSQDAVDDSLNSFSKV